jgi:hypothetical protein
MRGVDSLQFSAHKSMNIFQATTQEHLAAPPDRRVLPVGQNALFHFPIVQWVSGNPQGDCNSGIEIASNQLRCAQYFRHCRSTPAH